MKSFESFRKGERGNNAKNNAKIEEEGEKNEREEVGNWEIFGRQASWRERGGSTVTGTTAKTQRKINNN